uniref:Uncharacterized protein n=3 Tax=Amphimedon queenslandica TaxID=400682 RepID=A0A1X7ST99_AMPQE
MHLAKAFCNIRNDYGLKAMAHIWYEVIQELRYRWENGIALPSLGKSHPDMSCCLLHQKLQMLNNCILHKISHAKRLHYSQLSGETSESKLSPSPEEQSPTSSLSFSQRIQCQISSEQQPLPQTPPSSTGYHKSTSSDSDEEFFEAQETFEEHHKEDFSTSSVSLLDSITKKLLEHIVPQLCIYCNQILIPLLLINFNPGLSFGVTHQPNMLE